MLSIAMVRWGTGPRCPRTQGCTYAHCWDLGDLYSVLETGPCGEGGKTPKPVMNGIEKSDRGIVAKKATNKGANLRSRWSEGSDPRGSRKILAHTIR